MWARFACLFWGVLANSWSRAWFGWMAGHCDLSCHSASLSDDVGESTHSLLRAFPLTVVTDMISALLKFRFSTGYHMSILRVKHLLSIVQGTRVSKCWMATDTDITTATQTRN